MVSCISIIARALKIKGMHITGVTYITGIAEKYHEEYQKDHILVNARPYKREQRKCPVCGKKCPVYDHKAKTPSSWRANALNGVPIIIQYAPVRIQCREHGVLTESIPWADGTSRFTAGFNNDVAFMALTSPKTVVCQFMGINWRTVGNCIAATHNRIEPDPSIRLRGLKRICVDETSYSSGHKYITVVYDIDRNRVVWLHIGHGQSVFAEFCEALTPEERNGIEVVAGDGARWIDSCTKEYFKNAKRCVDFFHVVGWVNEVLDKVKNRARREAEHEVDELKKSMKQADEVEKKTAKEIEEVKKKLSKLPKRGRPGKEKRELQAYLKKLEAALSKLQGNEESAVTEEEYLAAKKELEKMPKQGRYSKRKTCLKRIVTLYEEGKGNGVRLSDINQKQIDDLYRKVEALKESKYALGMNPENLNQKLKDKLEVIKVIQPDVYLAYRYKEQVRAILHMKNRELAEIELDRWIAEVGNCSIQLFEELSKKISRHKENILNAVELQVNSSRSEATNTTIKALIATARGFRNLTNMFALIYLRCSDLVVPLNNRYQPSAEKMRSMRDIQNERRKARVDAKQKCL